MTKRITDRKILTVELPKNPHFLNVSGSDRFDTKDRSLAGSYQTQDWGRTWVRILSVRAYLDGLDLEDAIKSLRDSAEGLTHPSIDILDEDSYSYVYIKGTRPATDEEVAEVLRYLVWDKAWREQRDQDARERLIKQAKALGLKPEDLT